MMTLTNFIQYLEAERDNCLLQANTLADDERRDESNMLKIRANIFDVFAIVSQTAEKRFPQNRIGFIKDKIETIPAAWKAALTAAEKQNAQDKITAERIKLQAMMEISQQFNEVLGESQ